MTKKGTLAKMMTDSLMLLFLLGILVLPISAISLTNLKTQNPNVLSKEDVREVTQTTQSTSGK